MSGHRFDVLQKNALSAAYVATTYRLTLDEASISIRVGATCPLLDVWLRTNGFSCWAWLTAENPGSRQLLAAANSKCRAALECTLTRSSWRLFASVAVPDDPAWPAEKGLLLPGMDESAARSIAARFGQNAFLCGQVGEAALLCWTAESGRSLGNSGDDR